MSWWMHSWHMNQLFYNIFNLMENFFFQGICLLMSWACTIGIWSTLAQLNLITQIYWLCYKPFWCLLCYLSIVTLCWSFLTLYRLYLSLMFLLSKWFLQVTCWGTFVRIFYISRWGYSCNMIQKLTNWMYDIYMVSCWKSISWTVGSLVSVCCVLYCTTQK